MIGATRSRCRNSKDWIPKIGTGGLLLLLRGGPFLCVGGLGGAAGAEGSGEFEKVGEAGFAVTVQIVLGVTF